MTPQCSEEVQGAVWLQSHLYPRGPCGGCWRGASSSLEPRRSDTPCPAGQGTDEAHTPAPPWLQHKNTHMVLPL